MPSNVNTLGHQGIEACALQLPPSSENHPGKMRDSARETGPAQHKATLCITHEMQSHHFLFHQVVALLRPLLGAGLAAERPVKVPLRPHWQ